MRKILGLFFAVFILGCSNSSSSQESPAPDKPKLSFLTFDQASNLPIQEDGMFTKFEEAEAGVYGLKEIVFVEENLSSGDLGLLGQRLITEGDLNSGELASRFSNKIFGFSEGLNLPLYIHKQDKSVVMDELRSYRLTIDQEAEIKKTVGKRGERLENIDLGLFFHPIQYNNQKYEWPAPTGEIFYLTVQQNEQGLILVWQGKNQENSLSIRMVYNKLEAPRPPYSPSEILLLEKTYPELLASKITTSFNETPFWEESLGLSIQATKISSIPNGVWALSSVQHLSFGLNTFHYELKNTLMPTKEEFFHFRWSQKVKNKYLSFTFPLASSLRKSDNLLICSPGTKKYNWQLELFNNSEVDQQAVSQLKESLECPYYWKDLWNAEYNPVKGHYKLISGYFKVFRFMDSENKFLLTFGTSENKMNTLLIFEKMEKQN